MKNKILKKLKKSILFYMILYIIIFVITNFILNIFSMSFRAWVYIFSLIFVCIGFVAGILQLLCKIKKKVVKIVLIILFIISLIPCFLYGFVIGILAYHQEHVVIRDGEKMVAYVYGWLDTDVSYYDYKNLFFVGNKIKVKEYYGNGGFDPIENEYGYDPPVTSTYYYDEDGKIIKIED